MATTIPLAPGFESAADEADAIIAMNVGAIAGFPAERILAMLDGLATLGGGPIWAVTTWASNGLERGAIVYALRRLAFGYDEKADDLLKVMEAEDVGFDVPATLTNVPQIVDFTEVNAILAIEAADLVPGTRSEEYHPTIVVGNVTQQDPVAPTEVEVGTAVDYTVSLGEAP